MTELNQQLRIIAQPKAFYRDRYGSEQYENGNRAQRYVRAEDNPLKHEYPTVEIPGEWWNDTHHLYIRVASITVPNQNVSTACVHPYPIDTDDSNVQKDPINNALYFPITNDDLINGQKSFLLTRKKLLQKELKLHGPLRIFGSDERHISHIMNKSRSKRLIKTYQLWKSQLVFTRAEHVDNDVFRLFTDSSVSSQVMSDEICQQRNTAAPVVPTNDDENSIICAPEKGSWAGGDQVLMVLKKLDRKKPLRIYFDYVELNKKNIIQYELVDAKTITFETPTCLIATSDQNRIVPIVAMQDEKIIGKFNFIYMAPSILSATNVSSCCPRHTFSDVVRSIISNKRCRSSFTDLFSDPEFDWE